MKTMRYNNAAAKVASLRTGFLCAKFFRSTAALLLLSLASLAPQNGYSQLVWEDLGSFSLGYELSTGDPFLQPGQQFHIKLYGDVPIGEEAIGLRFELDLDSRVSVTPATSLSLPDSSWLGESAELVEKDYLYQGGFEKVKVHRPDMGTRDGLGHVLNLHVTVGENGLNANQVVDALGGSIVIVDNMELRTAEPMQAAAELLPSSLKVFPNPCTDWIEVDGLQGSWTATVLNMAQVPVMKVEMGSGERVDIRHLAKGMYVVILEGQNGEGRQTLRLIKR